MTQLATISYANHKFEYILEDGEPWFRAKSVATVLEYENNEQTIRTHVHQDDRRKYSELQVGSIVSGTPTYIDHNLMNSIFINESGLYSLIMRSKKRVVRHFQQWVQGKCFHQEEWKRFINQRSMCHRTAEIFHSRDRGYQEEENSSNKQ